MPDAPHASRRPKGVGVRPRTVVPAWRGALRRARLPKHAARLRGVDEPVRILLQEQTLPNEVAGCLLHGANVPLVVVVALLQRLARISRGDPLRFGGRKREVGAAQ